jgi:gamma-aminobutyric acid type B receptor
MQHPNDKIEAKYNTDAGVSKEDEDRYHSLLAENDDLQKLIAAVSSYKKYNQAHVQNPDIFRKRKRSGS